MSANLDFLKNDILKTNKNTNLLGRNIIQNTGEKMNKIINSDKTFFSSFYTWIIFSILLFLAIVLS